MTKGGRNLILLGASSVLVAAITTSVSLIIYHNSGDIYLDRSRPGYLPDEAEIEEENGKEGQDYEFSKNGKLKIEDINEYLDELEVEMEALDAYKNPFGEEVLSDEALGILEE